MKRQISVIYVWIFYYLPSNAYTVGLDFVKHVLISGTKELIVAQTNVHKNGSMLKFLLLKSS
jgi:hypothetical protein